MSSRKPRSGGARARRSFSPAQKLELLAGIPHIDYADADDGPGE